MNTSLSWIKAYVPDLDVTAQEYTDAMTLSGTRTGKRWIYSVLTTVRNGRRYQAGEKTLALRSDNVTESASFGRISTSVIKRRRSGLH